MCYLAIINKKIVGYSDHKKIVKKYLKGYKASHPESITTLAQSMSELALSKEDEIIPIGSIFLQQKYENAYWAFGYMDNDEISKVIKFLEELYLTEKNPKKRKVIFDGLEVMTKIYQQVSTYIPSIHELNELLHRYESYIYTVSV